MFCFAASSSRIPIFSSCYFAPHWPVVNDHPKHTWPPWPWHWSWSIWDVKIVISCNVLFCSIILIPINANYLVGKVEQIGCPIFFSLFYQLHGCQLAQVPLKHHHLWLRKDWKVFFFDCSLCHLPQFNNSFWCQFFSSMCFRYWLRMMSLVATTEQFFKAFLLEAFLITFFLLLTRKALLGRNATSAISQEGNFKITKNWALLVCFDLCCCIHWFLCLYIYLAV